MLRRKIKINWLSFLVLVVYPILIVGLAIAYCSTYGISYFEIGLMVASYYGANISVGIGLHRLWSHATYKTNKVVEFILVLLSAGTLQGPVLAWASDHFKHHTFTDKEQDPHSPTKYKSKVMGFLWSHLLWMLLTESSYKHIDRLTMAKLGKNKLLIWQLKYYGQIAVFMNLVLPLTIGFAIGGTLVSAAAGFIFMGLGRAFQQQMTFCVNSLCHFIGTKNYYAGTARDIWWLFFLLLGENWHNFHHAFANDYRNGHKWYHFDIHKWIIYGMEKCGLAWDLVRTSEERIKVKMQLTKDSITSDIASNLKIFEQKAEHIKTLAIKAKFKLEEKYLQASEKVDEMAIRYKQKLEALEAKADSLKIYIHSMIEQNKADSEDAIYRLKQKLSQLEKLSWNMGLHLQGA